MPQVQIARVEQRDACKIDVERNAFVRRAVGMDGQRAETALVAGGHAHAAMRFGNVKAQNIRRLFAAQIVDRRGKMVVVVVADEHIQLFKRRERLFAGQTALIRAGLACVEEQAGYRPAIRGSRFPLNIQWRYPSYRCAPFFGFTPFILSNFFHLSIILG